MPSTKNIIRCLIVMRSAISVIQYVKNKLTVGTNQNWPTYTRFGLTEVGDLKIKDKLGIKSGFQRPDFVKGPISYMVRKNRLWSQRIGPTNSHFSTGRFENLLFCKELPSRNNNLEMNRRFYLPLIVALAFMSLALISYAPDQNPPNAGLTTPEGFRAEIIADGLGRTRHLTVTPQGNIYVRLNRLVEGNGTIYLKKENDTYKKATSFGNFAGTGIYLKGEYLYTSSDEEVFRYKLDKNNEVIDPSTPERIVSGLVNKGQHESKSIVLDNAGNLYVNIGAPSNSCQQQDRQKGSKGMPDCPLLETAGGIWAFEADKSDQSYGEGKRYATGLRNVVGLDWNGQTNELFVMQHGRDQLNGIFPELFTIKQSAELPSECMFALKDGSNCGWPYVYHDGVKMMQAPEYGGDGKTEVKDKFQAPVAGYPAHMAPNDLLFYTGTQFPAKYRNGAFIAFHGSWNRAPEPQAGYFVVFQPFKDGRPFGDWEIFADGFSGSPENTASGRAQRRPCGLAMGPDGSMFVSDDVKGTIYKISYSK